uniref:Odorant receptor n=1 Tax=Phlebotomus papatasi TaxID=29031 RepID=A0A3F2ZEL1_PHLPP
MIRYIECYSDYLRLENFIKTSLNTLSCSFLSRKLFGESGKYFIHIYHLYTFLGLITSSFYFANNITMWSIIVAEFITVIQMLIKYLAILSNKENLEQLFIWIRHLHERHEINSIRNSTEKLLSTNLEIILRILKFIFPCSIVAGLGFGYYVITTDTIIFAVPWLEPNDNNKSLIYHHINQIIITCLSSVIIIFYDAIFISIGFYFIAVLNIFRDMIQCLDNPELKNRRKILKICYLFHWSILSKFKLFNNVFYGYLFIQIVSCASYIFILFYLMFTTEDFSFVPASITVYFQFGALCIFGEAVYTKSERIFIDLYLTNWYDFNSVDQKFLLMMMKMSMKPIGFKFAGAYDINCVMFIQVMKIGFSYGTLLYTFS